MNSNISIGFPQDHITNVFVFVGMESSEESLSFSPADRYVNILSTSVYSKSAFKILSLWKDLEHVLWCKLLLRLEKKNYELLSFFLKSSEACDTNSYEFIHFWNLFMIFFLIYPPFELLYFPLFVHFVHCL